MINIQMLNKTFDLGQGVIDAVKDVTLSVQDGEIYGVIGYSGAGKSTLVRCINLLETPDSGVLSVDDKEEIVAINRKLFIKTKGQDSPPRPMSEKRLNELRRGIGMIFQHFNLLDRSTVYENIAYPIRYSGMTKAEITERVRELLRLVDLEDKIDAYPSQLSGGQKQRVAIARALANKPAILLSDEATSALDPDATESVLSLLKDLNQKLGLTIILITHEMAVIKAICNRVAVMEEGRVVEEGSVYQVFSRPQQKITQKFVESASSLGRIYKMIDEKSPLIRLSGNARLVRLYFERDCVGDAIISNVSRECNIDLSIVLANVEILEDSPLGGMIAVLSGNEKDIASAFSFFERNHVRAEVLANGTDH